MIAYIVRWIIYFIGAGISIFIMGGLTIPDTWRVERTLLIPVSPTKLLEELGDLHHWQNWVPWSSEGDASQVNEYEGPDSGPGSKWSWHSEKFGAGWVEITGADLRNGVTYKAYLDLNGYQTSFQGLFTYDGKIDGALVTWRNFGTSGGNWVQRWSSLAKRRRLGRGMEDGLLKLKNQVAVF